MQHDFADESDIDILAISHYFIIVVKRIYGLYKFLNWLCCNHIRYILEMQD